MLYIRRLLPSGPKPTERSTDTIVQFWNDYRFLFHRVLNVVFDENKPKLICSLFQYSNSDVIQKPLILLCQTEATHKANTKFAVAIHNNCHSLDTLSYYKFVCLFVCFLPLSFYMRPTYSTLWFNNHPSTATKPTQQWKRGTVWLQRRFLSCRDAYNKMHWKYLDNNKVPLFRWVLRFFILS